MLESPIQTQYHTSLWKAPSKNAWLLDNAAIELVKIVLQSIKDFL